MNAVMITGMSGAGKSTIAAVLAQRGLVSIDADDEMDERTMLARLDAPSRDNDWGRIGDTREYLRRRLPEYQDRLRAFGAIPIDARQPLDHVVDAILSHALAGSAASRASQPS